MQQPNESSTDILSLAKQELWEEISLPTNNPALKKAIELHQVGLVEATFNGDYDLALRRATFFNIKEIVPLLLPQVTDINSTSSKQKNRSALHFAAMHGEKDIVQLILKANSYIDLLDEDHNTALHLACENKHYKVAALLLENGASVTRNRMKQLPLGMESNINITTADEIKSCISMAKVKRQQKLALPPLSQSDQWVLNPQMCCVTRVSSDLYFKKCLVEVLERNRINYFTVPQIITLEAKTNSNLNTLITQGLGYKENALCLNIHAARVNNFFSFVKHKICLEKHFEIHFELIFTNFNNSENGFFKASERFSLEKLKGIDTSLYKFDTATNILLINNTSLPALLPYLTDSAEVNVRVESNVPKLIK